MKKALLLLRRFSRYALHGMDDSMFYRDRWITACARRTDHQVIPYVQYQKTSGIYTGFIKSWNHDRKS